MRLDASRRRRAKHCAMALTAAEKMKARRARLKAAGKCLICGGADARPGKTTCEKCNTSAKARVKAGRLRRRTVRP